MLVQFKYGISSSFSVNLKENIVTIKIRGAKGPRGYTCHRFLKTGNYLFVKGIACYSAIEVLEVFSKRGPHKDVNRIASDALAEWVLLGEIDE